MRRRTAALLLAIGVLAVVLVLWQRPWSLGETAAGAAFRPPPPLVQVAVAEARAVETTVRAVGSVEAAESIIVTSPVPGTVERLHFAEGQRVEAGAPLVELDATAEFAALEAARAEYHDARGNLQRLERLTGSGAVSAAALDEAKARLDTARARVNESRAAADDRRITAPFAGTVGLAQVSPGAVIESGEPITTLATVAQLKLAFRVPASLLAQLRPGLAVRARVQGVARPFEGQITRMDTAVDPATRSVAVEAALPDAPALRPGMFAALEVVLDTHEAVVVPEEAVLLEGEQVYVYTVDERSMATRTPITPGERRDGWVEIREGLAHGMRVVTAGAQKVIPGQPVTLPNAAGQAP